MFHEWRFFKNDRKNFDMFPRADDIEISLINQFHILDPRGDDNSAI